MCIPPLQHKASNDGESGEKPRRYAGNPDRWDRNDGNDEGSGDNDGEGGEKPRGYAGIRAGSHFPIPPHPSSCGGESFALVVPLSLLRESQCLTRLAKSKDMVCSLLYFKRTGQNGKGSYHVNKLPPFKINDEERGCMEWSVGHSRGALSMWDKNHPSALADFQVWLLHSVCSECTRLYTV